MLYARRIEVILVKREDDEILLGRGGEGVKCNLWKRIHLE